MGYIRTGACPPEQCQGRCCKHILWWFPVDNETREWVITRGLKASVEGGMLAVDVPQRCQFLTDDNLCALHPDMDPDPSLPPRPEVCNKWPTHPSQLVADSYCGFSFVEE